MRHSWHVRHGHLRAQVARPADMCALQDCVCCEGLGGVGMGCCARLQELELELVVSDVVRVLTAWLTAYVPTCVCVGAAVQMLHVASLRGVDEIRARRGTPGRGGGAVEMHEACVGWRERECVGVRELN